MKILYFYQYFSTPKGSWGTRVYEFTKDWVEQGHQVIVVTSIYSKSDLVASKFIEDQKIDGVLVKVINVRIDNKQHVLKRLLTFIQYAIISSYYALTIKSDVVIASSGPITVGIPGLISNLFRKTPLVFEARDLWPEGAIELGVIRNKWMIKIAYWFERILYKRSKLVVGLSPGMKHYIEKNHNHKNVISVTNSANLKLFGEKRKLLDVFGLKENSYAIYTGNIGEVNNSHWLLDSALILKNMGFEHLKIVLVGDGPMKNELLTKSVELSIDNFIILDLMPKIELVPLIQNALVSLVPLKGTPILDTSSPNKFFESLAAGVPVIQNTNGWMKDYLDEYNVGYTVSPVSPTQLAETIIEISNNPSKRKVMGENATLLAKKDFDQKVLSTKMLKAIQNIV